MANQSILFPYNFTTLDQKALEFVCNTYSDRPAVTVTLLHLYTPVPEIDVDKLSVMANLQTSMNYLRQKITEQQNALEAVHSRMLERGFDSANLRLWFKPRKSDVAGDIIELIKAQPFDVIILNHKSGKVSRFFTGSVHNKLANALTDVTISIVT